MHACAYRVNRNMIDDEAATYPYIANFQLFIQLFDARKC
jgi:hypothetical protein